MSIWTPEGASDDYKRRNPHLFPLLGYPPHVGNESPPPVRKPRLRQDSKPKLNKLETAFLEVLKREHPDAFINAQAITFRLANGLRYTPDFVLFAPMPGTVDAYEVKGFMRDDAAVKIKVAASIFPHIKWVLVWRENGSWMQQTILADS